jgi:uncharacterized membrane protein
MEEGFTRNEWIRLIAVIAWLAIFVYRPQLVLAVTLLIIGGVMIVFNAINFWATVVRKRESPSVLPVFGGIMAAIGIAILPVEGVWKWAWIPLLLDWGGLPVYLAALFGYNK